MQSLFFSILTASAITAAVPPSPGRLEDERCVFVSAHLPAASPPLREKWQTLRLKPKILDDAARMPPESLLRLFVAPGPVVRTPIQSSLSQLTDGRIKRLDSGIQIDAEGLDERWRELKGPGPHVVNWFAGGRFVQLLLFERGRDWWVASAMAAEAKSRDASFLLLDGDANGSWWDAHDFVSFMGGALRPLGGVDRVDDGTRRGRIRLAGSNGAVSLQFQPSERPEGLDDDQWLALNAANEQRNRHGLPPLLVWREVNEGLLAHTRFLHQHAPMKEGPLNSYYGEPDGMEGRSDAGAEASRSGCVAFLTESMTIAGHVASCITMTQSRFQVGIKRKSSLSTSSTYSIRTGFLSVL